MRRNDDHNGRQDQGGKHAEHAQGGEGAVDALAEGVGHGKSPGEIVRCGMLAGLPVFRTTRLGRP